MEKRLLEMEQQYKRELEEMEREYRRNKNVASRKKINNNFTILGIWKPNRTTSAVIIFIDCEQFGGIEIANQTKYIEIW